MHSRVLGLCGGCLVVVMAEIFVPVAAAFGGTSTLNRQSSTITTTTTTPMHLLQRTIRRRAGRSSFGVLLLQEQQQSDNNSHNENDNESLWKKEQNEFMEEACQEGAAQVEKMSIEERTKRAMLAELLEDEIFIMTEELEEIVLRQPQQQPQLSKEEMALLLQSKAQLIKDKQIQYQALVTGKPSSLLTTLDSLRKDLNLDSEN